MPGPLVIGVDLGGTKLVAGVVDGTLAVSARHQVQAPTRDSDAVIEAVVDTVQAVRREAEGEVAAVGFGIPCLFDDRSGRAVMAVNLPLADVPFAAVMAERLGLPVWVDNDANLALLAEHRFGAARGSRTAVMLTVGTGIGGGLVLGGELFRGAVGAGGELGHMVVDLDGPRCQGNCPNRGCLEAVASGTALAREGRRLAAEHSDSELARAGEDITGVLVTELAHRGDPVAIEAVALVGRRLGVGIASLVNILNPEVVVIGGGVIAAGELLLGPAREEMAARALSPSRELVRVVPAAFGAESGMLGAAVLALEGCSAPVREPA